ncbi:Polyisoprenyl-teichoic acid--peptidoglycan teichoic acid transferase TagT [Neobacillus rhizosphaerae]|uniref:Polyisoprenyl-teichoic acid--peptidoglycan teichoic acid transferase TagT n=1 Tax=Neobacillus rhizosphaerae TaxID=2880965 RepID=A0ABN8KWQ4_9BACI|nr:LCP family protein [Neobacillus rhizosphaerae]CAH2716880.1 Polyisoprenyl-teichoic acid--peptidoglycan teichoic acid transferase TagT [Neobacillus rhizosphaerae]
MPEIQRSQLVNRKKKSRKKRIFMWIFLPILFVALCGAGYATFLLKKAESVVNKSYKPVNATSKRTAQVDPDMDNISILLIGVDASKSREKQYGDAVRSDALLVATLNKKEKSVKLLSIPRDSYVHIPEKDIYTKINHAHAYGGAKLSIETVQELLDIPIDYYVKVNFYAFIDVVNALGGIDVDVPYAISEKDSEDHHNAIRLKPGFQTLKGEQALALARTRHQDTDVMRGMRQQEIIKAIFKKAMSVQSFSKHANMIDAVGDNMETNMSFNDMKSLIDYGLAGSGLTIDTLNLKGEDTYINKIYYYKLDKQNLEETQSILKAHLGTDSTTTNAAHANTGSNENSSTNTN